MTSCCPLWLVHMLCVGVIMGIGGGVQIYLSNQQSSGALLKAYDSFSVEVANNMAGTVDSIVQAIRDASLVVDVFEPRLATCGEPPVNHTGEVLLRALTALPDGTTGKENTWLSLGLMQRASKDPVPSANVTAKWSWQVAAGFGCPEYIYAYIDQQTAPAFLGYCARLNKSNALELSSKVAYNGTDWGFTPLERAMLFGGEFDEAFVPTKVLLGVLEFSYRRLVRCNDKPYALVFASRSTGHLDIALAAQRQQQQDDVAFIIERDTGLLVAASIANQTHAAGSDARVSITNATDARIRESVNYLVRNAGSYEPLMRKPTPGDKLFVTVKPYAPVRGIDWLLIVATDASKLIEPIEQDVATTRTTVIVTVVVTVLLAGLATFLLITLPVRRLLTIPRKDRGSLCCSFRELSDIDSALLQAEKTHN